jgi:SAM-dependent methyltransferase
MTVAHDQHDQAARFDELAELLDSFAADTEGIYRDWVEAHVPLDGGRAVDLGCGSGRFIGLLADRYDDVLAIDISARQIELAKAACPRPNVVDPGTWTSRGWHVQEAFRDALDSYRNRSRDHNAAADVLRLRLHPVWLDHVTTRVPLTRPLFHAACNRVFPRAQFTDGLNHVAAAMHWTDPGRYAGPSPASLTAQPGAGQGTGTGGVATRRAGLGRGPAPCPA